MYGKGHRVRQFFVQLGLFVGFCAFVAGFVWGLFVLADAWNDATSHNTDDDAAVATRGE